MLLNTYNLRQIISKKTQNECQNIATNVFNEILQGRLLRSLLILTEGLKFIKILMIVTPSFGNMHSNTGFYLQLAVILEHASIQI